MRVVAMQPVSPALLPHRPHDALVNGLAHCSRAHRPPVAQLLLASGRGRQPAGRAWPRVHPHGHGATEDGNETTQRLAGPGPGLIRRDGGLEVGWRPLDDDVDGRRGKKKGCGILKCGEVAPAIHEVIDACMNVKLSRQYRPSPSLFGVSCSDTFLVRFVSAS